MEDEGWKNHRAEEAKYHPLILQETLHSRILAVTSKIQTTKKYNYLQNLYHSFKNALKCDKCGNTLKIDSIAFACEHKFCKKCSVKISTCSLCMKLGYDTGTRLQCDFSALLNDIISMQKHCNAESTVFNLIRFFIDSSSMDFKDDPGNRQSRQFSVPSVPSTVKNSTSKRSATKSNKQDNSKRKLQFNKNISPLLARTSDYDSETLFLDATDKIPKNEKVIHSYLEQQTSIFDESPKFDKNLKTYSRNPKRKFSCLNSISESPQENEESEAENCASKRIKTTHSRSPTAFENENVGNKITAYVSSAKKSHRKVSKDSIETLSDSDFKDCETSDTAQENDAYATDNRSLRRSCRNRPNEKSDENSAPKANSEKLTPAIKIRRIRLQNEQEASVDNPPIKKLVEKSIPADDPVGKIAEAVPRVSKQQRVVQVISGEGSRSSRSNRNKKLLENSRKQATATDTVEISTRKEQNDINENVGSLKSAEKPTLRKNRAKRIRISGRTENSVAVERKIVEDAKIDKSTRKAGKENLEANTSDSDTEDVVDIKLWDRNDRQSRKKKKLFKSLKERKKSNILLKLLEEKKLLKEKRDQENNTIRDTLLSESIHPETDRTPTVNANEELSFLKEENSVDISDQKFSQEDTVTNLMQTSVCERLSLKSSPKSVLDELVTSPVERPFQKCRSESMADDTKTPSIERPSPERSSASAADNTNTSSIKQLLLKFSPKSLVDETKRLSLKNSPKSATGEIQPSSHNVDSFEGLSPKSGPQPVPDQAKLTSYYVHSAERVSPKICSKSVPDETTSLSPSNTERLVNPIPRSPKVENTNMLETVSTPSLLRSKFFYPIVSPKFGEHSNSSPLPNLVNVGVVSSTPITRRREKNDELQLPNNENEETLKSNNANTLFSSTEKGYDSSQYEDTEAKYTVKRKCANLKRAIDNQNQKLLVSVKKNFHVMSPQSLLIEKSKMKSVTMDKSFARLEQVDVKTSDGQNESHLDCYQKRDESPTINSLATVPNSSHAKEVACQTTSELHVALLMREFPHLFERSSLPLSVYDTPAQSDVKSNNETLLIARTPKCVNAVAKYTTVSSITTSEKKRADMEFANQSVLCDSLRTPFGCFDANNYSPAEISSISPLPSSEKKPYVSGTQDSDRRRLSVRLNFQGGTNNELVESPSIIPLPNDDEMLCSKDVISCTENNKCSNLRNTLPGPSIEKRSSSSNASKEIEFMDANEEERGSEKIYENDREVKSIFTAEVDYVADSAVQIGDDVEIFKEEDDEGRRSPKRQNSDDEEIDFIAGTPTCYAKRGAENSAEKVRSQTQAMQASSLDEKSRLLFDSNECHAGTSKSAERAEPNSIPETSAVDCSLQNNVSATSSFNKPCSSRSLNFSTTRSTANEKIICFTTSSLKDVDFRLTKVFCEKFPVIMEDKLTSESTHLIVKTDEENRASRTFKFLQAVVSCVYIVSINWVAECLRRGHIVNEEEFIPLDSSNECGPLRAYHVAKGLTPSPLSWLRDYCVLFKQPIPHGCSLSQLQDIVKKTGAVVVNSLEQMDLYPKYHHVIIISDSDDDENMENITTNIRNWLQRYQAVAIEFNWLLEVIGRNRLVPFADHEFVEIPPGILQRLNFPNEMLQSEMENTE